MSVYIPNENRIRTCPYDEAHRIKESRFQLHIAKCKLNNLEKLKKICPFNATHLLQEGEYDHHLINCPDRGALDRQLAQSVDKNNPYKGRTDVPYYSEPILSEECWEIGTETVRLPSPPPGAVIEPPPMSKPAERRKLYKELHQRPTAADKEKEGNKTSVPSSSGAAAAAAAPVPKVVTTPRQPKQPSETQRIQSMHQPNSHVMQNLGMGRGRPPRVAANFSQTNGASGNFSYSSMVQGVNNLAIGRGARVKQEGPSPFTLGDFPALACGRGVRP